MVRGRRVLEYVTLPESRHGGVRVTGGRVTGGLAGLGTEYDGNHPTRDRPVCRQTGPPPLLLLDGYLDFAVKNHHDEQQEEEVR